MMGKLGTYFFYIFKNIFKKESYLNIDNFQKRKKYLKQLPACTSAHLRSGEVYNFWKRSYLNLFCYSHMCGDKEVFKGIHM